MVAGQEAGEGGAVRAAQFGQVRKPLRISRLVAAWVRTCTSSPMARACAASASTSIGSVRPGSGRSPGRPPRAGTPAGPRPPRCHTRTRPPHQVPATPAHRRWSRRLVGQHVQRRPRAQRGRPSAPPPGWLGRAEPDLAPAQPPVGLLRVVRPALRHRRGPHRPPQRIGRVGVLDGRAQCSRVVSGRSGTASATVVMPVSSGMPRSSLAQHLGVGRLDPLGMRPVQPASAATALAAPPAVTRQSTEITGAPCARIASPNSGRPTLTTPTRVRQGQGCVISRSFSGASVPVPVRCGAVLGGGVLVGAAARGGQQRVLGGPVGLPPAPGLGGQLVGLRRDLPAIRRTSSGAAPPSVVLLTTICHGSSAGGQVAGRPGPAAAR